MFPILRLGPLALQMPGLVLLLGVWLGLSLAEKEAARLKLNPETIYNLALRGLAAGLIGGRLSYVGRYLSIYAADPLSVFSLNPATLAPTDGVLIGLLAAIVYGARKQLPLRPTLDALAPAFVVLGLALAGAHLASGDAFGAPARLPWSIYLWDEYRHPSQVYEALATFGVLGAWWLARSRPSFASFNFLLVVALSAAARVFLEAFRGDSFILAGGLRAAQVSGLVVLALCLWGMWAWSRAWRCYTII